jgi:hypothetical protein
MLIVYGWLHARHLAQMLAQYTVNEPLSWSSFMVDRARWAADVLERGCDSELTAAGKQLLARGQGMGLKRSLNIFSELGRTGFERVAS